MSGRGGSRLTRREALWEARQQRLLRGFLTGLVLLALCFSASRGGIVSALAAASVFVLLGGTRRKKALAAVAGCWLVLVGYGMVLGFDEILARFDRLEGGAEGRFRLWADTWRMIRDHPWTGVGLGSFDHVFALYQTHLGEGQFAGHAHCDYLQWIAELGWPLGLAGIGAVWTFWARLAARTAALARAVPPADVTTAAGALAGMAAFLIHCWVDFPFQMAGNALIFFSLAALAAAEVETAAGVPRTESDRGTGE